MLRKTLQTVRAVRSLNFNGGSITASVHRVAVDAYIFNVSGSIRKECYSKERETADGPKSPRRTFGFGDVVSAVFVRPSRTT